MPLVRSILSRRFCCRRARTLGGNTSHRCSSTKRSRKYRASPLISSQCNNLCHPFSERLYRRDHCSGNGLRKVSRTASRINCSSLKEFDTILVVRVDIEVSACISPDCRGDG